MFRVSCHGCVRMLRARIGMYPKEDLSERNTLHSVLNIVVPMV